MSDDATTTEPSAQAPPATTTGVFKVPDDWTDDLIIEKYLALRDRRDVLKKQHTEQLAPYNSIMHTMENAMLARLLSRQAQNTRTENGTAYISEDVSVTVRAWSQTFGFIEDNKLWEILEARVSKTAVLSYQAETGTEIPGLNIRRENRVHIRRSS